MSGTQSSIPSDSLVSREQNFDYENKKAIVVGAAAVLAAGAAGYYLYASNPRGRPAIGKAEKEAEVDKGVAGDVKKKKKKKTKVGEKDGPILEERTPKPQTPEKVSEVPDGG